jgi:hypothetical protein
MRITIDVSDSQEPGAGTSATVSTPQQSGYEPAVAPPPDVAARAAAEGALSGGPAPADATAAGPIVFTGAPGTPGATPTPQGAAAGESAGAAPQFLTGGAVEETQVEAES